MPLKGQCKLEIYVFPSAHRIQLICHVHVMNISKFVYKNQNINIICVHVLSHTLRIKYLVNNI